jgi:hypothetical protein
VTLSISIEAGVFNLGHKTAIPGIVRSTRDARLTVLVVAKPKSEQRMADGFRRLAFDRIWTAFPVPRSVDILFNDKGALITQPGPIIQWEIESTRDGPRYPSIRSVEPRFLHVLLTLCRTIRV